MTGAPKTKGLLEGVGALLYGSRWQQEMAAALGVTDRTIRRWHSDNGLIPANVWKEVEGLARARRQACAAAVDAVKAWRKDMLVVVTEDPSNNGYIARRNDRTWRVMFLGSGALVPSVGPDDDIPGDVVDAVVEYDEVMAAKRAKGGDAS